MKIGVLGPGWPEKREPLSDPVDYSADKIQLKLPLEIEASTLEEAISKYEVLCSASVTRYDGEIDHISIDEGGKHGYFMHSDSKGRTLVGVFINRGDEFLKPGHDLTIVMEDGDVVHIGSYGC